jgi:hypothetical protein
VKLDIRWHLSKYNRTRCLTAIIGELTQNATAGYFDDLASHGLDLIVFLLGNIKNFRNES